MKSWCLCVSKEKAEVVRQKLLKEGLIRTDLKIRKGRKYVYIPIKKKISFKEGNVKKMEFEEMKKILTFKEYALFLIQKKYGERVKVPSSFDVIGDIAIMKLSEDLIKYKKEIGNALLATHSNIKVVCIDKGIRDEKRIRDVEIIAGEYRTETVHKEHGIKIFVDIKKAYYSPRLATERKRIAQMVKKGDVVVDMFAGVAPFSLVIAKFAHPSLIYAIDNNPDAVFFANKNVWANKLADKIKVIQGDAMKIVPKLPKADHIIMNLPHSSFKFFPVAIAKGKMIHYYEIMEREKIEEKIKLLEKEALKKGKALEIINVRKIGNYSPSMSKICIDILIKENNSRPSQALLQ